MLGEIEEGTDDHTPSQLLMGDVLIVCAQVKIYTSQYNM
jgi:hypothetical protein